MLSNEGSLVDHVISEMSEVDLSWEVKGSISPAESVSAMLHVISEKGEGNSGTFFCWDGRVSIFIFRSVFKSCTDWMLNRATPGVAEALSSAWKL